MKKKVWGESKLGVSRCLLGENVRCDGGHRLDRFITETLGQFVQYIPVCPEVECGLPIPREAMRLVGAPDTSRLVTIRSLKDHTDRMMAWAKRRVTELEKEGLCGFIFKSNSPSSGMERVKVYNAQGIPVTLLKHFARKHRQPYLMEQAYLNLHPMELKLRNHI